MIEVANIEQIKNEYFVEDYIQPQEEPLYRIDTPSGRVYSTIDKEKIIKLFASTTTIIQKYSPMDRFLFKWWCEKGYDEGQRIYKELGRYGTFEHIIFKDILCKQNIDISTFGLRLRILRYCEEQEIDGREINIEEWITKSKQDTLGIIQWVQDFEVEPVAIEITLFSPELKYAGTLDLPCLVKLKGSDEKQLVIVDYKTGRNAFYNDCPIQLESYRWLWNEAYPDRQVDRVFNIGAKDFRIPLGKSVTPYRWQEQTDSKFIKKWWYYHKMFLDDIEEFRPKKKAKIIDESVNMSTNITEMFGEDDPLQFLHEINGEAF